MKLETGNKIRKPYPFIHWVNDWLEFGGEHRSKEGWSGGCHKELENQYSESTVFTADDMGEIEYEVLAVVPMPRKYQDRVIYRITMINPEGGEKRSSKDYTVTISKFMSWVDAVDSPYPYPYEVNAE